LRADVEMKGNEKKNKSANVDGSVKHLISRWNQCLDGTDDREMLAWTAVVYDIGTAIPIGAVDDESKSKSKAKTAADVKAMSVAVRKNAWDALVARASLLSKQETKDDKLESLAVIVKSLREDYPTMGSPRLRFFFATMLTVPFFHKMCHWGAVPDPVLEGTSFQAYVNRCMKPMWDRRYKAPIRVFDKHTQVGKGRDQLQLLHKEAQRRGDAVAAAVRGWSAEQVAMSHRNGKDAATFKAIFGDRNPIEHFFDVAAAVRPEHGNNLYAAICREVYVSQYKHQSGGKRLERVKSAYMCHLQWQEWLRDWLADELSFEPLRESELPTTKAPKKKRTTKKSSTKKSSKSSSTKKSAKSSSTKKSVKSSSNKKTKSATVEKRKKKDPGASGPQVFRERVLLVFFCPFVLSLAL
jgi:hypothetical protein